MYFNIKFNVKKLSIAVMAGLLLLSIFLLPKTTESSIQANKTDKETELPIIMYHSVLKDEKLHGKYVISPAELESDVKYLKENGYTTIVFKDLIDYVYNGKPLPEKPIMLTFDDGYYNNYRYAFEIMKKYDCKMVLSVIGYYTDKFSEANEENANYGHVTWKNIKEMAESGYVEIQNHTYNMHDSSGGRLGAQKKPGESEEQYRTAITQDIMKLENELKENLNYNSTAFVYPFGAVSKESDGILKDMGFKATATCEEKINIITTDKESLYGLGRFIRVSGVSSENFFSEVVARMKSRA